MPSKFGSPPGGRSSGDRAAASGRPRRQPEDDGGFETVATGRGAQDGDSFPGDAAQDAPARSRTGPSLKARAVGYLSRREHSRIELARKLRPYAESPEDIDSVLNDLQREGWLSNERFAQGLAHRRASRQGTARIVQELRQHGLDDAQVAELRDSLRATEYDRALEVWRKRFGAAPADRAQYGKQARFLAGRGFAHEVIRRILGGEHDD